MQARQTRRSWRWRAVVAGLITTMAGCASGPHATPSYLAAPAVVLPHDFDRGQAQSWEALSPEETAALLARELPPAPLLEPGITDLQMLERATGRRVLWVPPLPTRLRQTASKGRPYTEFLRQWGDDPPPTVGALLRSILTSETDGGTTVIRMAGWYPAPGESPVSSRGSAWKNAQAKALGLPELLDVALVTRQHIVILAVPKD